MTISIGTVAPAEKQSALCELIRALRRSKRPPHELLVGVFGKGRLNLPNAGFRIRQFVFNPDEASLPTARRAIAAEAGGKHVVWLEPDAAPDENFIDECAKAFEQGRTGKSGENRPASSYPAGSVVPLPVMGRRSIRAA